MRPAKDTAKSKASFITNLASVFTPAVANFSTVKAISDELPEGLSLLKSLSTEEKMTEIFSALTGERFVFSLLKASKLQDHLTYYFTESGVTNLYVMLIMTDANTWHNHSKIEDDNNPLPLIIFPVTLLLSQIDSYIERLLSNSLFLTELISYEARTKCFNINQSLKFPKNPSNHTATSKL